MLKSKDSTIVLAIAIFFMHPDPYVRTFGAFRFGPSRTRLSANVGSVYRSGPILGSVCLLGQIIVGVVAGSHMSQSVERVTNRGILELRASKPIAQRSVRRTARFDGTDQDYPEAFALGSPHHFPGVFPDVV